jgi:DNA-binding MarR family transcriptional regulator
MNESSSPSDWRTLLERRLSAAAIAAHRDFPTVCFEYTDRLLALRRGERLMNQILAQREREMLGFMLLCQHFEALDGGKPPTLARLAASGLGSKRRIAAFVAVLRLAGLVRSRHGTGDRRVRILEPTERLIAMHTDWSRAALRQLDRLLDRPVLEAAFDADPRFYRVACQAGAKEIFEGGAFAPGRFAFVDFLTPHRTGHLIAASLAQAMFAGRGAPALQFPLPYGRLARRLGVSRSHVLNVFAEAQARGFLEVADAGRLVTLTAATARGVVEYFAHELAFAARHAVRALDDKPPTTTS